MCKNPPPQAAPAGGGAPRGGAPGGGAPGGGAARGAAPAGPVEYNVTEIPGVIAAGQKWKTIWETAGNNADGIIGLDDGSVMVAQNDNSAVMKIDKDGKATVAYSDTNTGGALSMNTKGALFIVERGLNTSVWQLAPQRKMLTNMINGDFLDCAGGIINDISADSKGGAYFTMGNMAGGYIYYASPAGIVTRYGQNLATNGLILSADEKTMYVTNNATLVAFDVKADGSLANQHDFVTIQGFRGDGTTIDSTGRIYITGGSGVQVVSPDGKSLGLIPTPRGVISTAFGGTDKKTLYAVVSYRGGPNNAQSAQVISIPMIAQGFKGRVK
jgi:gluconolactonase